MPSDAFVHDGQCSPVLSIVLALASLAACLVLVAFAGVVRRSSLRAAAQVAATPDESAPSVGRRTIRGVVAADAGVVVTVDVLQKDELEGHKGNALWVEKSRSIDARPFYLVLASGEQVRVEPGSDVRLHVAPAPAVQRGPGERVCRLSLAAGAEVSVSGVVEIGPNPHGGVAGYRAEAQGFVLRAPPGEALVIAAATVRSLKSTPRRRLDFPLYVLAMLAMHGLLFGQLYLLLVDGQVSEAVVTQVTREAVHTKNGDVFDYRLTATGPASRVLTESTTAAAYEHRQDEPPLRVPFVVSRHLPRFYEIGSAPRVGWLGSLLAVVLGVVLTLLSIVRIPSNRAPDRLVHAGNAG